MLQVQKILKSGSMNINELAKKYDLELKTYSLPAGTKYQLSYKMDSDFSIDVVRECRGLILDENFDVLSTTFYKFFNYGEPLAANFNFTSAKVLEKLDGSCISLYWCPYRNEFMCQTTGTGECEASIDGCSNFKDLFWKSFGDLSKLELLNKNYIYTFELTTPENIVVVEHDTYSVTLISVKDRSVDWEVPRIGELSFSSQIEIAIELGINYAKEYKFETMAQILAFLKTKDHNFEGFVLIEDNFNRLKIKSEEYLIKHRELNLGRNALVMTILNKEAEEMKATFELYSNKMSKYVAKLETIINTRAAEIDSEIDDIIAQLQKDLGKSDVVSNRKEWFTQIEKLSIGYLKLYLIERLLKNNRAIVVFREKYNTHSRQIRRAIFQKKSI